MLWVRHLSWCFISEATRRIHTKTYRPCFRISPKLHPESRVGCDLLLMNSSAMKRRTDRGLPIEDMSKSSSLLVAAKTKVEVASRPILGEVTFLPQGSLFVKDENRMTTQPLGTCNPQVDMEVSALVEDLFIPQLRWLGRNSCILFRQSASIDATDFHFRARDSAP